MTGYFGLDDHIYVLDLGDLRLRVLQYSHDHPLVGHFSQTKTLHQVQRQYTWLGLPEFVKHYCKSCTICARAKPQHHKPLWATEATPRYPRSHGT